MGTSGAELFAEIIAWQRQVFSAATQQSVLAHLRREMRELEEHPDDLDEMADVLHLIINLSALRSDYLPDDLWHALGRKFAVNQRRQWQPPDHEGVYQHRKDAV